MKKILIPALFALFAFSQGFAEDNAGARPAGMGQSFWAVEGGPDSVYFNPAGLAGTDAMEADLGLNSVFTAGRLGFSGGAIFALPLETLGGAPLAVHANGRQTEGQKMQGAGVTLAGKIFRRKYNWGTNLKWRSETISDTQLTLMDIGLQTKWEKEQIAAGAGVKNIFSGDNPLAPVTPMLGIGYTSDFGLMTGDLSWLNNKMYFSGGWEKALLSGLAAARLGYTGSESARITAGLGANLWPVSFDTAFSWPVNDRDSGIFQFTVKYRFGGQHFSEIYLNRAVEKAAALEERINRLEQEKGELNSTLGDSMFVPQKAAETQKAPQSPAAAAPSPKSAAPAAEKAVEEKTPAKEKPAPAPKKKVVWPQYHKVEQGDTLRDIAQQYYEDPGKWQIIYRANTEKIVRGRPQVGAELLIPEP